MKIAFHYIMNYGQETMSNERWALGIYAKSCFCFVFWIYIFFRINNKSNLISSILKRNNINKTIHSIGLVEVTTSVRINTLYIIIYLYVVGFGFSNVLLRLCSFVWLHSIGIVAIEVNARKHWAQNTRP